MAKEEAWLLKATGIVRRIDELGRVVIPKEIRRTLRIREGDPLHISWSASERFAQGMLHLGARLSGPPPTTSFHSKRPFRQKNLNSPRLWGQ